MRDWQEAYPEAVTYAAPLVAKEAKLTGAVFYVTLEGSPVEAWEDMPQVTVAAIEGMAVGAGA